MWRSAKNDFSKSRTAAPVVALAIGSEGRVRQPAPMQASKLPAIAIGERRIVRQ
jgi:hypothetical protein